MNLDLDAAVVKRRIQISELEEMRLKAYENARIYVTTPSEIIPYNHLNHSIWSLSVNKEPSR
jgi:hypothetical protein